MLRHSIHLDITQDYFIKRFALGVGIMKKILAELAFLRSESQFPYRRYMKKNKCIFIHIPKSAGTSILSILGQSERKPRDHLPWYIYKKANRLKFDRYFKFAFVRNPIDRAYSAYSYLEKGGNLKADMFYIKEFEKFRGFDDFVVNGLGKGMYRNTPLFIPQSQYVVGNDQKLAVDYLGKFETIDEDFKYVADRLRLNNILPKVNSSQQKKEMELSREGVEVLENIYLQDFIRFGYSPDYS